MSRAKCNHCGKKYVKKTPLQRICAPCRKLPKTLPRFKRIVETAVTPPESVDPTRAKRIAHYTERAKLELPLFSS